MADQSSVTGINLQSLILADHIYQDRLSGKYIIAGTFHQLNLPSFPTTLGKTIGVFVSLLGLTGKVGVDLAFVEAAKGQVLMSTRSLEISCDNPELPVDFALEVPPLSLPSAGQYYFQLSVNGTVLGKVPVFARIQGK